MTSVRFAIPKGSLEKATIELLQQAGYEVRGHDRTYRPQLSDPAVTLKLLRPQEIPIFVQEGLYDIGVTGQDWIAETNAQVQSLLNLEYGQVRAVAAVPREVHASSLDALVEEHAAEAKLLRVSTEYLNLTSRYLRGLVSYRQRFGNAEPLIVTPWWRRGDNPHVRIFLSFGATEAKPPEEADVIVDVIQTGTTLEQNNLRVIETVLASSAVLIGNPAALRDPLKRTKIYDVLGLLKGVILSRQKLHIFLNVSRENLPQVLAALPALRRPTVSPLADEGWFAVNTVIDRSVLFDLLPTLRRLAQGLVIHEPRQILPLEEIARDETAQ